MDEALSKWQKILRLQDWDVHVIVVRGKDMNPVDRLGQLNYNMDKKTALIRLLDHVDWDDYPQWPHDQERSLVHELVHLHLLPLSKSFESGSMELMFEEQAVDLITSALISLDRR